MKKALAALLVVVLLAFIFVVIARKEKSAPDNSASPVESKELIATPPAAPSLASNTPAPTGAIENAVSNEQPMAASAVASQAVAPVIPANPLRVITSNPLEITNIPPQVVMGNLRNTFALYTSMFGENPVGINSEITAALAGKNPRQADFMKPDDGMRTNANGELIDPWGTPYFFHQLSGKVMEIHSAGPDKVMWTADDLVVQ